MSSLRVMCVIVCGMCLVCELDLYLYSIVIGFKKNSVRIS
jgi:hypothetical protein